MTPKCHCGRRAVWAFKHEKKMFELCESCAWTYAADKVLTPIEAVKK